VQEVFASALSSFPLGQHAANRKRTTSVAPPLAVSSAHAVPTPPPAQPRQPIVPQDARASPAEARTRACPAPQQLSPTQQQQQQQQLASTRLRDRVG